MQNLVVEVRSLCQMAHLIMLSGMRLDATTLSAHVLLGLRKAPRNELAWVEVIRSGVSGRAADKLAAPLDWTLQELATAINVPLRTLHRHKAAGTRLLKGDAERLVRFAQVLERVQAVFEDPKKSAAWLSGPVLGLGGRAPRELLDTDAGATLVLSELDRLEHGIFS